MSLGQEIVLCDDVALAKSLQLAADIEYAESISALIRRYDRSRSRKTVVRRDDRNAQRSSARFPVPPIIQGSPVPVPVSRSSRRIKRDNSYSNSKSNNVKQRSEDTERPAKAPNHSLLSTQNDGSADAERNNSLLHVACEINDRLVELMVDTGASTSVMSVSMMKKLGLEPLLNTRMQGVAAGVGTARIVGRIENCPIQVSKVKMTELKNEGISLYT